MDAGRGEIIRHPQSQEARESPRYGSRAERAASPVCPQKHVRADRTAAILHARPSDDARDDPRETSTGAYRVSRTPAAAPPCPSSGARGAPSGRPWHTFGRRLPSHARARKKRAHTRLRHAQDLRGEAWPWPAVTCLAMAIAVAVRAACPASHPPIAAHLRRRRPALNSGPATARPELWRPS
ncbi:uncharacterized protein PHACADRAFT_191124 [Phanerochaete carnosa HHB-10118-sp]|uniref:Uncharacterized protein n=1 Tax=Phanerochaete carnosa (strain HHB-10118-sp) TaxID=650164 RepID=K5W4H5_PHACS|nr:uncharacterized protein PHACADRAFT_191124 [Phanerochaete carnosa HHB-10118-sp]EKM58788.1 hypothetical protein PHACADRAFT_191124 [Phanerochaete carnosa HHB-10118-sp]